MIERPASAYGSGYALDRAAQDASRIARRALLAVTIDLYWSSIGLGSRRLKVSAEPSLRRLGLFTAAFPQIIHWSTYAMVAGGTDRLLSLWKLVGAILADKGCDRFVLRDLSRVISHKVAARIFGCGEVSLCLTRIIRSTDQQFLSIRPQCSHS
jgi:hypothetical protein